MRYTKLKITNIYGITEYEANGESFELYGSNGTNKTSVIDAIRLALTNDSNREYIVKKGANEGEILLEFENIKINRKFRVDRGDYKSVKQDDKEVQGPEAFLKSVFNPLQLNPVEFISKSQKEQNRIILDMIDFKWNLETIRDWFGEIPPGVDYEKNILEVLNQIQAEDGHYFLKRQDINRDIKSKKAVVDEMVSSLPDEFNPTKWQEYDLETIYREIEQDSNYNTQIDKAEALKANYDNKIRGFEAEKEIAVSSINNSIVSEENLLNTEIARLEETIKAKRQEILGLNEKKETKIKLAESEFDKKVAQFNQELKSFEEYIGKPKLDIQAKKEAATYALKMKSHLPDYNRMISMNEQIKSLVKDSEAYTEKIERARTLPGTILKESKLPLENMTIDGDIPLINGLPVSNLSEGQKLELCVDIAINNSNGLQIILIDGVEKLSENNRTKLYNKCKEAGIQFIATRTTDDSELGIITFD